METTRNAGSCCGHHGATSAPAHRTAAPAPQGYTPVDQLHNEIDRLFGDFFGGFFSPWRAFSGMAPRSADNAPDMLIPHMDLSVTDTAYKATVELPGVAQDQVNIEVRDNMLIVEGEKKNETEDKDEKKGYYRMERSYGSFRRVLSLPEDVETDKITATHKDGVLSIEIPRKEPEKPAARKIEVVKGEHLMRLGRASFRMLPPQTLPREPLEKTCKEAFRSRFSQILRPLALAIRT